MGFLTMTATAEDIRRYDREGFEHLNNEGPDFDPDKAVNVAADQVITTDDDDEETDNETA